MFETMREEGRLEEGYEGYFCNFHNEVFNTDYKYSLNHKAIEALEEDSVFEAISSIIEYEKDNYAAKFNEGRAKGFKEALELLEQIMG